MTDPQHRTVLIVEDHPITSSGLAALIRTLDDSVSVIECVSLGLAVEAIHQQVPRHIFLDLRLPDVDGFESLGRFRALAPGVPITMVCAEEQPEIVHKCLQLGARAYIPKSLARRAFEAAVALVLQGGSFVPDGAASGLAAVARVPLPESHTKPWGLTPRQLAVAALLVDGMPNKLIADRLGIAESTVKLHVSGILRQMRVTNRSQALLALASSGVRLPVQASDALLERGFEDLAADGLAKKRDALG